MQAIGAMGIRTTESNSTPAAVPDPRCQQLLMHLANIFGKREWKLGRRCSLHINGLRNPRGLADWSISMQLSSFAMGLCIATSVTSALHGHHCSLRIPVARA